MGLCGWSLVRCPRPFPSSFLERHCRARGRAAGLTRASFPPPSHTHHLHRHQQHNQDYLSASATTNTSPPRMTARIAQLPRAEQALLLLGFIMLTIMTSLIGILGLFLPIFFAIQRALRSLKKLKVLARSEIPDTLASIRLSGIEINDLMLQLNKLRTCLRSMPSKCPVESKDIDSTNKAKGNKNS